jgi:hypothetical protein
MKNEWVNENGKSIGPYGNSYENRQQQRVTPITPPKSYIIQREGTQPQE